MWRLWTKGWGIRAWWRWLTHDRIPLAVAYTLPRRVALVTFVRVYAAAAQCPGDDYVRVYKAWEAGNGR